MSYFRILSIRFQRRFSKLRAPMVLMSTYDESNSLSARKFQNEIEKITGEMEASKGFYANMVNSIENGLKTFELRMNSFAHDSETAFKLYRKDARTVADNFEQVLMSS